MKCKTLALGIGQIFHIAIGLLTALFLLPHVNDRLNVTLITDLYS